MPAPAAGWPARGSSPAPWPRPASAAGWRSCWPGGRQAGGSISGGNGYAGPARIAARSGSTCVVGFGSWAAPKRTAHLAAHTGGAPATLSAKKTQKQPKKTGLHRGGEENPKEEDLIFKPAELLHFQHGDDTVLQDHAERLGPPRVSDGPDHPRRVLASNVGYFQAHQGQMDYPTYRAKGWPIGSGVAESGVKLFNKRVKGTEQFWNPPQVESILSLRALWLSQDGRWSRYWDNRPAYTMAA